MADTGTISFSEAATMAIAASDAQLTDKQEATLESLLGGTMNARQRLARRKVYDRMVADGVTVIDADGKTVPLSSVPIEAVPWGQLLQLLMTLIPTLIPLICPPTPTPTPSLSASGG